MRRIRIGTPCFILKRESNMNPSIFTTPGFGSACISRRSQTRRVCGGRSVFLDFTERDFTDLVSGELIGGQQAAVLSPGAAASFFATIPQKTCSDAPKARRGASRGVVASFIKVNFLKFKHHPGMGDPDHLH